MELSLLGYGNDPASTTDNSKLSEDQVRWLDERRVGQLAIASLQVDDHELVIRDHYPGFIRVFSYGWDGYTYSFHSIDEAVNRREKDGQRVRVSGRSYCALYGRFDSWMKYEYELRLDDDGVGCETLTLIPEQDTDFSPHRNGRPNNYSGIGSSLSGLSFAARVTRPVFATALVAPFADIEPKGFEVISMDGFLTRRVIDEVRRVIEDADYRQKMVDRNYELSKAFFSYVVLRRKLRSLITNLTGLDDI